MSTAARQYADGPARDGIVTRLDESLIVEASAGTGKTTALVDRILAALQAGYARIEHVAALTFTHKAAGEMKFRLRQKLEQARLQAEDAQVRRRLDEAQTHLEEAYVGTIHSFCAQILRERPVEAFVDPLFEEAAAPQQNALLNEVALAWLDDSILQELPGVRRAMMRMSWLDREPDSPASRFTGAIRERVEWRHFPKPWQHPEFPRQPEMQALTQAAAQLAEWRYAARVPSDPLAMALQPAVEFTNWVQRTEALARGQWDAIEARLLQMGRLMKASARVGRGEYSMQVSREQVRDLREVMLGALGQFQERANAELAYLLHEELKSAVALYEDLKRRQGSLDFLDLLIKTRDLVRDNLAVRRFLQARYTHLFVDEFQDTDPIQAELLLLLCADDADEQQWREVRVRPGKFFAVGDPKQSIYKFRQADVALYQEVRKMLEGRGVSVLRLTHSFRANVNLQAAVNHAFRGSMKQELGEGHCDYDDLEGSEGPIDGQPSVIALPLTRTKFFNDKPTKTSVQNELPISIVAWLRWLLQESGWKVRDPRAPQQLVPVEPGHVCLLFRKTVDYQTDMLAPYVELLEEAGIPYVSLNVKDSLRREETLAIRTALEAVEWPDDELAVYSALRGPLFGIADDVLFEFAQTIGRLHPLRVEWPATAEHLQPVRQAMEVLAALHRGRNHRPCADTVSELLAATRAHAAMGIKAGGAQSLAGVSKLVELARVYESQGGLSFRDFLGLLEQGSAGEESSTVESDFNGVHLMTVHKAKGLEYPVVVLADLMTSMHRENPQRFVDPIDGLCAHPILGFAPMELVSNQALESQREQAEGLRLAYVAATRARDLLVMPVLGRGEIENSWLGPLIKAVMPSRPRGAGRAQGCPDFGLVTWAGDDEGVSVQPGQHRIDDHFDVVWWDPMLLAWKPGSAGEVLRRDLLEPPPTGASTGEPEYRAWAASRERRILAGAKPTWEIVNPSRAAIDARIQQIEVEVAYVDRAERTGGRLFGQLVHALLERIPLDIKIKTLRAEASTEALVLGLSAEVAEAAVEAVSRTLRHSLLQQARASLELHREWPVDVVVDEERRLEGSIDLAFRDGEAWHIVDYKTDADTEPLLGAHRQQLAWYAWAIGQLTGRPVRATILSI